MAETPGSFADLGLSAELLAHLASRAIAAPTPVQAKVIPAALAGIRGPGGDILAQARTGSGKTLAFLLPLATAVRDHGCARAWVVCPTRELAQQVAREASLVLGANKVATLIGGAPWGFQSRELSSNPPLVVGTPGRMRDHLDRGTLKADAEILVLDEADQMLDMGFREELDALVKDLGEGVARWLFSATFPPAVANAVDRWLTNPTEIRLDERQASSHVPQKYVIAPRGQELPALVRLLQVLDPGRALVFTRTRIAVEQTVQGLALAGIEAAGISGDLQQDARERVLARFRGGKLPVLVATDVAARGLDVQGVTHVFNLSLPVGAASYTHRIGRTARAGAEGEAWTVIAPFERGRLLALARSSGSNSTQATVPTANEIVNARRHRLAVRLQESLGESLTLPSEFAELATAHGAEAVLAALVHRLVPEAPVEKSRPLQAAPPGKGADAASVALFVALGEMDGATPAAVVSSICRAANIAGHQIGRIRIFPRHSLLHVTPDVVERVLSASLHVRGRTVAIRPDRQGPVPAPAHAPARAAAPAPRAPAPAPARAALAGLVADRTGGTAASGSRASRSARPAAVSGATARGTRSCAGRDACAPAPAPPSRRGPRAAAATGCGAAQHQQLAPPATAHRRGHPRRTDQQSPTPLPPGASAPTPSAPATAAPPRQRRRGPAKSSSRLPSAAPRA